MVRNAHTSTAPNPAADVVDVVIKMPRRVGQHEWRRAIRGQMPTSTFAVAHAVVSYTNKDGGKAHPGNERLAADLSCTTKTVQRALRWLRTEGWLQLDQPAGQPGRSRKLAQEWSLTIPERWTSTTGPEDVGVHPPDPDLHQSSSLKLVHSPSGRALISDPCPDPHDPDYDLLAAEDWLIDQYGEFDVHQASGVIGMLGSGAHPMMVLRWLRKAATS